MPTDKDEVEESKRSDSSEAHQTPQWFDLAPLQSSRKPDALEQESAVAELVRRGVLPDTDIDLTGNGGGERATPNETEVEKKAAKPEGFDLSNLKVEEKQALKLALTEMVPVLNKIIELKNEQAVKQDKPELGSKDRAYDLDKLKQELDTGRFGCESARVWSTANKFVSAGVIDQLQVLDDRGLDIPDGCPVDVPRDKSGRHIGDELFRAKLKNGQIEFKVDQSTGGDGSPPQVQDIVRMINSAGFINKAQLVLRSADIKMSASKIETEIHKTHSSNRLNDATNGMDGWLPEADQSDADLERWTYGAGSWLDTIGKVQSTAHTIAFLNHATSHRTDPGLEGLLQKLPTMAQLMDGVDDNVAKVFSDEALKDGIFPGTVTRDAATGKIIKLELDLPTTPERTDENRIKLKSLETWLTKYGGKVDQIKKEFTETLIGEGRLVMAFNDEYPATVYPEQTPDGKPHPKAGEPLQYPDGHAKAGQPIGEFNHMRYGVDVREKDGLIYVKPYQQGYYARLYAYNRWNILGDNQVACVNVGAMQKVGDPIYARGQDAKGYKPDDYVAICDNGRMAVIQARYLKQWSAGQENAEQVGKCAALALDTVMIVSGTIELRAGKLALTAGGELGGRLAWKEVAKGSWHIGVGMTGFGKQAIENTFGDYGKSFTKWRHYAIMAELTFTTFAPGAAGKASSLIFGEAKGAGAMEKYLAASGFGKTEQAATAFKGIKGYDRWLATAHNVMAGTRIPYSPLQAGVFPIADYYFLYDMTSAMGPGIADVLSGRNNNCDLMKVLEKNGVVFEPGKPHFPETSAESCRQSALRVLTGYGRELSESASAMLKEAAQLIGMAPIGSERQKAIIKYSKIFRDEKAFREDKIAAAVTLMSLRSQDSVDNVVGYRDLGRVEVTHSEGQGRNTRTKVIRHENFDNLDSGKSRVAEFQGQYPVKDRYAVRQTWTRDEVKTSEVIDYLRTQAGAGNPASSRLVSADFLSRTSQAAQIHQLALESSVAEIEKVGPLASSELKQQLKTLTQALEGRRQFGQAARYDYRDLGGVCMDILNDKTSSRELKLNALVSAGNPRLGNVQEYLKYQLEPSIEKLDGDNRARELADLYGRDARAIDKVLSKVVSDVGEDRDVRAAAAAILYANSSARFSINGIPLSADGVAIVGSKSYVKVTGDGINPQHAEIKFSTESGITIRSLTPTSITWVLKPDGKQVSVGVKTLKVEPGDKIVLGDVTKGIGLVFGTERGDMLTALASKSLTGGNKPGSLQDFVESALKNQVGLDPRAYLLAERGEIRMTRLQTALLIEKMGDRAWFDSAAEKTAAINDAIVDAVHPSSPNAVALAVLQLSQERIQTLTTQQLINLRGRCLYMVGGKANDRDVDLRIAILTQIPEIFHSDTETGKAAAVLAVRRMLDSSLADPSNCFPLTYPELRVQAVKSLSTLDPKQAMDTLEGVLRTDGSSQVRLAALNELEKLGAPTLQSIVVDLLRSENDAANLKRLKTIEFFQRRPDPGSEDYRRQLVEARQKIVSSSNHSLVGMDEYIKAKAKIRAIEKSGQSYTFMEVAHLWIPGEGQLRVVSDYWTKPEISDLVAGKIPYDEKTAKALAYIASSNGRPFPERSSSREWAVLDATQAIASMCRAAGPQGAAKMAWVVESCLLRQNMMSPQARLELVEGLLALKPGENGGVISAEEAAVIAVTALERELKRTPSAKDEDQYEHSKNLQMALLDVLSRFPDVKALPVLESIADSSEHPIPEVRQKAQDLYQSLSQHTGQLRNTETMNPLQLSLAPLASRKESRSMNYQDAYERAKTDLTENWQAKLSRFQEKPKSVFNFSKMGFERTQKTWLEQKDFDKIDGAKLQREISKARFERYNPDRSLLVPLEELFSRATTIERERTKAANVVVDQMWKQYDELIIQAKADKADGKDNRDFLAFVVLSQGKPFLDEHREQAMQKAAQAIYEICNGKRRGAGDLDVVLKTALIEQTNLAPALRQTLLNAYLWTVEPNGKVAREQGAITIAMALENAYENMPKSGEPGYNESLKQQLQMLECLKNWKCLTVMPVLESLSKHHPSREMKNKSKEIFNEFRTRATDMEISSVLKQKDAPVSFKDSHERALSRPLLSSSK